MVIIIRLITASVVVIIVVATTAMDTYYGDDDDEYSAAVVKNAQRRRELVTYPEGYQPDGGGGVVEEDDPSLHYFCGAGFEEASTSCKHPCQSGSMRDCPTGMLCYFNTPCVNSNINNDPATITEEAATTVDYEGGLSIPIGTDVTIRHPTKSPVTNRQLTFFCGSTWADASADCSSWCPSENDEDCPSGQSCFGDTTCTYEPPPTMVPTPDPTEPTIAPSPPPQYYGELLSPGASNHMFCGGAVDPLGLGDCSAETHCPNGDIDCDPPGRCWNRDRCDIRNYLSWEEGGYVDRPSHETLAVTMNLTYPSDDPTDHYFCGITLDEANMGCSRPCPDKTTSNCAHGELCYEGTECDYRVMPGYGATPSPASIRATLSPIPYDDEMNYKFCGETWGDANTCQKRWCGNDASSCPPGQSCFADTECNILDRDPTDPPVPTITPTYAPVMYNDTSNTNFCGATYLAAVDDCSVETHCQSGEHTECGGGYCWPGVSCNIVDMLTSMPTTFTATPTIDSERPTLSPVVYDLPQNFRFCGTSWAEASASCTEEGDANPMWCPGGSDDECDDGATCWADTMCNGLDLTAPPSTQPVIMPPSAQPTGSPISEADQLKINIRFCGISYQNALEQCSIETHCPSGQHVECPDGGYCWSVIGCNIADMVNADATMSPSSSSPEDTTSSTLPPSFSITRELTLSPTTTKKLPSSSSSSPQQFTESPEGTSLTDVYDYFQSQRTLSPTYEPPTSSPSVDTLTLSEIRDQIHDNNSNQIVNNFNPSTNSPSQVADDTTTANTYFIPPPSTLSILPRPSKESSALIQRMIQGIKTIIISDFFVVKLRSGTTLPSSLYTYYGFLKSLTFFTDVGVGGMYYMYLGIGQSATEIEYGICNLALFLAKMMDTISHERCDSDFIACGIPPLGYDGMSSFQEQDVRVECSPLSSESGKECPNDTGCNCILGMLDHFIGIQSSSTSITEDYDNISVYSGVDFCKTDILQSICSRRVEHGEELRWIPPMAHWVYFVQPYDVDGWNYITELKDFVDGGMLDEDFVLHVGSLSVLGNEFASNDSNSLMETFQHTFFKVMRKLSEGIAEMNHFEGSTTTTTHPTTTSIKSSLVPITTRPSPSQLEDNTPSSFSTTSSHPVLMINEKDPIAASIIESANDGAAAVATSDKVVVGILSPSPKLSSSNKPTSLTSSPIINPFPWLSVEYDMTSGSKVINCNMNYMTIVAIHLCIIHYYYFFT